MSYWTGLQIIQQASLEMGLVAPTTIVGSTDVGTLQLLALLNASGNELITYYPWAQFKAQWNFTCDGVSASYDLPADWGYFVDQTQWDRTNRWPMLGPKSPQEWAWITGGLVASAPRVRFRVMDGKFYVWPVTITSNLNMEYVITGFAQDVSVTPFPGGTQVAMVSKDTDIVMFDPWLMVKFLKLKFYQLKAFDTTAVLTDFTRLFDSLTGKDVGAPVLNLNIQTTPMFIGPWSVPDGSWST